MTAAMLTPWGEQLDPEAPLPEYPRPQLVRGDWLNLNGRWDCTFTPYAEYDPLAVDDPTRPPRRWSGEIIVPFSPEMPLSGVGRALHHDQLLWYRRTFTLPRALGPGERVLLHFGAVDQSCRVAVDGIEVGGHTGGYLPFTFDITGALAGRVDEPAGSAGAHDPADADDPADAAGTHELVVAVRDVTDAAWLARGKQSGSRGGIWYTPQSGIWQTVWLEIVPATHVSHLDLVPHLDTGDLEITVHATTHGDAAPPAHVRIDAAGAPVASTEITPGQPTRIALAAPVRTWSPEDPFLYDIEVQLGADTVHSYVGMRSFGVGRDVHGHPRLLLNGAPYLPVGLLDQGYWPDGGYTAPSDAALEYDVQLAKDMGFTMLRKHIKVEPLRWYHHCDRLGMLVWQDAVNGGGRYRPLTITAPAVTRVRFDDGDHARFAREDATGRTHFEFELDDMIAHLRATPSIALWVPFNEGWGQFDAARIAAHVAALDPTRPVDHASGWHDQGAGDLQSLHVYFRRFRVPRRRDGRVLALTEYGGYSLAVPGRTWGRKTFGYRTYRTQAALRRAFERLHDREIAPAIARGLGAVVYTQLSDVEDEVNGLVSYDRRFIKIPIEAVRAVTDRLRAAAGGIE
ncbi:glycoside hydrolase family 2 protein [Microbacterium sp. MC2]